VPADNASFLAFPCVCPEPVLAKRREKGGLRTRGWVELRHQLVDLNDTFQRVAADRTKRQQQRRRFWLRFFWS
jgi:hypothetical protein